MLEGHPTPQHCDNQKWTYKFPKWPLGGGNAFVKDEALAFRPSTLCQCDWGSVQDMSLCVIWLLSTGLHCSRLCVCECVGVCVSVSKGGWARAGVLRACTHILSLWWAQAVAASLCSEEPSSHLFIQSPQLSRQHQFCLLAAIVVWCFVLF